MKKYPNEVNMVDIKKNKARPAGLRIVNTLKPRRNGRQFPDDIFKYIFL